MTALFKRFSLALLGALALSCSPEDISTGSVALTFGVTGTTLRYEVDTVSLLNAVNSVRETVVCGSDGSAVARRVPSAAKMLYAVFPYDNAVGGDFTPTLSTSQRQSRAGLFNCRNCPLAGSGAVVGGEASIALSPIGGVLSVDVFRSDGGSAAESVREVRLGAAGMRTVTVALDSAAALPSGSIYLALPRGAYSSLSITVRTDRFVYSVSTDSTVIDLSSESPGSLRVDLSEGTVALTSGGFGAEGMSGSTDITLRGSFSDPVPVESLPEGASYDIIPDFSTVGYAHGDAETPSYPNVVNAPVPDTSDFTSTLQSLIDGAPARSTVQLQAGTYVVRGILYLDRDDVVLRGAGAGATTILAAGTVKRPLIFVGRTVSGRKVTETVQTVYDEDGSESNVTELQVAHTSRTVYGGAEVTEDYTPVGRQYVTVADPSLFAVGDRVVLRRPASDRWIADIRMDCIAQNASGTVRQWAADDFILDHERIVTAVEGDRLYLDAPVVQALDSWYGGGYVLRCRWDRVSGVGVENLVLESEYVGDTDEQHAWTAVRVNAAEHCWIRGVTSRHFSFALVDLGTGARNVTVEDCRCTAPKSVITGSRRYAFQLSGGELCLIRGCCCESDRHSFATGARVGGPNVFLDCTSTGAFSDVGPHHRWATGCLYDCVSTDYTFTVQDGGGFGTGHGWQGANFVLWNCTAETARGNYGGVVCQRPWQGADAPRRSATNYAVGCNRRGTGRSYSSEDTLGPREQGEWASIGQKVSLPCAAPDGQLWWPSFSLSSFTNPQSLYCCQLEERRSKGITIGIL